MQEEQRYLEQLGPVSIPVAQVQVLRRAEMLLKVFVWETGFAGHGSVTVQAMLVLEQKSREMVMTAVQLITRVAVVVDYSLQAGLSLFVGVVFGSYPGMGG